MLIVAVTSRLRPRDQALSGGSAATPIDHVIADSGPGVNTASTNELGAPVALNPGLSSSRTGTIHSAALDTHPLAGTA